MVENNDKNKKDAVEEERDKIRKAFDNRGFVQLEEVERTALLEHYRRCQNFWTHWTPTIWSLPSVASGINIAFYTLVFTTKLAIHEQTLALGVLAVLNLILTLGHWKHQNMQKRFGDRIRGIERYVPIPDVELGRVQGHWSGSTAYFIAMIFLTATSLSLYINNLASLLSADPTKATDTLQLPCWVYWILLVAFGFILLIYVLIIPMVKEYRKKREPRQ